MSTETLRRAAQLMSERAETADHIAGMQPALAVALAAWLQAAYAQYELLGQQVPPEHPALAVARAYLGETR